MLTNARKAAIRLPPWRLNMPEVVAQPLSHRHGVIYAIARHGRIGWQRLSGYSRRSRVETAMSRYKAILGRRLHARTLPNQKTEAKIACNVLNRMTSLGMSVSVRIK
jgi:hypothetical protein